MVKRKQGTAYRCIIGCFLTIGLVVGAYAIDNPEAPDLIGEFEKREIIYLTDIDNPQNSTRDFLVAYDNYLTFLDEELNKASEILSSKLPEARKSELIAAQKYWINYRDAEFELIKNTWTRKEFGSSAGVSRGDYRTSIVKDRVIQLLHYVKNF
ncbi:lysozyme inhibitor LprI family protein [Moritella yayanosii]|uniref:Lysozyme inhibitor LprI-like N-terminal domain-containing protein n=1 Tax=Moritella yayanosii TaxID=69539 RepID=A0A330LKJ7_9GAMM|nr:lysozyme inhibitor LprI family protein [Moritella yayanosii]SQD76521.1 conserved protein of unknown function [Moritella yayanosii]